MQDKIVSWEAGREKIKQLLSGGSQNYFEKEFPDLKHAFLPDLQCVVCIDEGTAHKDMAGAAKFCLAGSGILYPAQSEDERVREAAKLFVKLGIKDVTSHGGCGAAALAYKRDFPDAKPAAQDLEQYAKDWARKVAEEMGHQGASAGHRHIEAPDMERPVEFHSARVVYYDGLGGFNPNKEVGLPMGFVISRALVPAEYAAEELQVAVNIAFGRHGFGDLFSAESPFFIVPMAGSKEELDQITTEAREALKDAAPYRAGKVKIDGVVIE